MHFGDMRRSIWSEIHAAPSPGPLPHEVEVLVIGAGIAGLTTAYQLVRRGVKVVVVDDGPIGGGETVRTSAHLASAVDDRFVELAKDFGDAGAQIVAESHAAAIDFIELTVAELGLDCGFRRVDGYLFGADGLELPEEMQAARKAGLDCEMVAHAPLPFDTGPAIRFARQAELEPMKYLAGLARAILERGGAIHTETRVAKIEKGEPVTVELANGRRILCRTVVDASNGAMSSWLALHLRQAAYRSYIVTFEIAAGSIPHALYWDTAEPYHYLRVATLDDGREVLIVGGGDHRVGQGDPEDAWIELEAWARRYVPGLGDVVARWSGQIIEPADGVAHIGKTPDMEHVFVVTGDSGNGLTHGTIAGLMLPDLIRGAEHRWAKVYDPGRSHLHSLGTLVSEATRSSLPYTDWVRRGDVASVDDISPNSGAVVRRGLHFVAVYRDGAGTCHERSATCPHLRGVVHWNSGEQSWDCPCHGSRFDPYGTVINGPAVSDLAILDEPARLPERSPREPAPALIIETLEQMK